MIQTAVYGVLAADTVLPTLSLTKDPDTDELTTVTVHNDIPEGQAYPHVLISNAWEQDWHTFGGPVSGLGWRNIIRIYTYSRYQGDIEALGIHSRIVALLNSQPLAVTGYTTAIVKYDGHKVFVKSVEKIETRELVGEFYVWVKQ